MAFENEVGTAFDIVLEEIENAIEGLNQEGAQAFHKGDYKRAGELKDKGAQLTAFRGKVSALRQEWGSIFATVAVPKRRRKRTRKARKRLAHGLLTQEDAYRVPVLQTLVELGGSGAVNEVLDRVGVLMQSQLNEYDRSGLPSTPGTPRWRNAAQWTRAAMVTEGLLASDSQRGVWEITDRGRAHLREHADDVAESLAPVREPRAEPAASPPLDQHFQKHPQLRPLFDLIRRKVKATCPNAHCYAGTKWINFKHNVIFMAGEVRKDHVELGIALGTDFEHGRYPRVERRTSRGGKAGWLGWQAKFSGSVRVYQASEVDEEFLELVRMAYEKN